MNTALLTITEATARMAAGGLTAAALVEALLAQIERLEGQLNCFITLDPGAVRAAAASADQRANGGPLHGIPIAVKDNLETAGLRATGGSIIMAKHVPTEDAPAWGRLRQAGAILLGKTNLTEFGLGPTNVNPHYGPTGNPWDPQRVPGGSSGGSAAAVAAGLAPAALGTDAGGSVRIPAALCGVVGLKATHGLIPVLGGIAFGNPTVDHIGPMTRSVADAALLLSLMAGPDQRDPTSSLAPPADYLGAALAGARQMRLNGLRIGVPTTHYFDPIEPGVEATVRAAIDHLGQMGAQITEIDLPDHGILMDGLVALSSEAVAFHEPWMRTRLAEYGEDVQVRLLANQFILGAEYARALRVRRLLRARYQAALAQVDLLAAPTVPVTAPTIAAARANAITVGKATEMVGLLARNTRPSNLTGLPAISLPAGLANGLPVGLMLIGRAFEEERLLHTAAAFEATTDWHRQSPPIATG